MKTIKTFESFLNERRSNYDKTDGPVIDEIKTALKKGRIDCGEMCEVMVDSNNRELPEGQYAIMPFTDGGDYWKARDLKRYEDKVIGDLKKNFNGNIELVKTDTGKSIRSYIIEVD
tara:strand:- start:1944 stop:2291 length:348 start_codon:yes stop_codon:yes gene_type:complete